MNVPDDLFQQAHIKALRERVAVGEVIRELLDRWVGGELELVASPRSREERLALARSARGMWADRNPNAYLAASRSGLQDRDEELEHARLVWPGLWPRLPARTIPRRTPIAGRPLRNR